MILIWFDSIVWVTGQNTKMRSQVLQTITWKSMETIQDPIFKLIDSWRYVSNTWLCIPQTTR